MAGKNPLDIQTALQRESFRIRMNTLSPLLRRRFKKLTYIERIFYGSVVLSVLLLMLSIVFVRTRILQIQTNTNSMRIEMSNQQTEISQYNQEIQGLTSLNKVGQSATQNGMTIDNSNIIKVSK